MKKLITLTILLGITLAFTACKAEKKEQPKQKTKKTYPFSLKEANNTINWVAYKTTDKLPVKGTFKKVTITKNGFGNTAKEAINGAEFSIPVSSIFTSDAGRDSKLKQFFFGVMDKTEILSGTLTIENDSIGYADLTMNGVTKKLPFKYTLNAKEFKISATMLLENWNAQHAIDSLNLACKDLHKAADGISKTWNDVAINITTIFK
ncbi:MAG: YceI family protein [Flavobacteriaceae bacterium]|nr:YceI family protein [Flavobacteriaceae bacterium]